jgi:hypothetical protein
MPKKHGHGQSRRAVGFPIVLVLVLEKAVLAWTGSTDKSVFEHQIPGSFENAQYNTPNRGRARARWGKAAINDTDFDPKVNFRKIFLIKKNFRKHP